MGSLNSSKIMRKNLNNVVNPSTYQKGASNEAKITVAQTTGSEKSTARVASQFINNLLI